MRKSVTKIVKAVLGFTMAIGAFVGAAVLNNGQAKPVVALSGSLGDKVTSANFDAGQKVIMVNSDVNKYVNSITTGSNGWLSTNGGSIDNAMEFTLGGTASAASLKTSANKYVGFTGTKNVSLNNSSTAPFYITASGDVCIGSSSSVLRHNDSSKGFRVYDNEYKVANLYYVTPDSGTYTVTYDANGGEGSIVDNNSPYSSGTTVTVLSNSFTRSGYNFVCFNTQANGFGTDYAPGSTFNINTNVTLYAKWRYPHTDVDNNVTWDLTKTSYTTMGETSASWVSDHITISASKESSSNPVNNWCPPEKDQTRFYKNSSLTITPASGYKINSIVFTASNNDYAGVLKNSSWTNATASSSGAAVTVVPTTKINAVSVTMGAVAGVNQIVVNYAVYHALDHISISGTYPTSFMQGDAFSHEGMIVTATYDDSSTAVVTSFATWSGYNMSGSGSQTVTVSYTEELVEKTATYSITVTVAPYITPDETLVNGQVGGNDVVTFVFGNLNGSLNVVSSNTSIVTVGEPDCDVNEGLVQLNFVGSGTTTVLFKDGDAEMSSVSVTVSRTVHETLTQKIFADFTTTMNTSAGFVITSNANISKKTGYYQDGGTVDSEVNFFMVKGASPLFATEPAAIKFTARICGGTAKDPLDHNVEACFVDSEGNEIELTKQTVTTKVTGSAKNYTINLPYSSSAYGVKIMHVKENSWNIRYYSYTLSYDFGNTVKTINGTEVKEGNVVTSVDSVVLRFGAKLSADNWAAFNTLHTISDYGIMFATASALSTNSLSSVAEAFSKNQSLVRFVNKGSSTAPSLSNGNYVFTARINILATSDYGTVYCAAPFFVSDGQYYFLEETRCSVNSLAGECLTNHSGSSLSDEALTILAGN